MSAGIAHYIRLLLLGGLLGCGGQFLRAIVGLIKLPGFFGGTAQAFLAARFLTSLFIGFIAGSAAALLASLANDQTISSVAGKFCLVAAGYAGTDFIEAIIGSFAAASPPPIGAGTAHAAAEPAPTANGGFDRAIDSTMASRGQANLLMN